jgi:DNA-binding FadR family transcriptional regulator
MLPGRAQASFDEHTEIVEAIAAHDPAAAERAMRRHLQRVAKALRTHADDAARSAASNGQGRASSS